MKVRSLIITVVSSLIVGGGVWAIGLVCFTRLVPFTSPELIMPTEGIVVFTGGVGRLTAALTLFQEGKGKYLLISGVNPDSTFPSTIADLPQRSRITLGYEALDTPGNAEETARWVRQNHIKTLRLITSHYHMPRSLLELRRLLPDVDILPHGGIGKRLQNSQWWRNAASLTVVVQEYNKFLFALIRRPFEDVQRLFVAQEKTI